LKSIINMDITSNPIYEILKLYLPTELVFKILFHFQGLQHPISKLLQNTCCHLEKNYGSIFNLDSQNKKIKKCQCQVQILLKWKYPSCIYTDLDIYSQINNYDSAYPYEPRNPNQETRVRWIFYGYQKRYIFGSIQEI